MVALDAGHNFWYGTTACTASTGEWATVEYDTNWVDTDNTRYYDEPLIDSQVLEGWDPDKNEYGG